MTATSNPYEKRFHRERKARKEAEQILESKSLELYESNQALQSLADTLEVKVAERTEELEREKSRALALSQAKSDFVATMSHEIRTPINGILGALQLLNSEIKSDECSRLLGIADHSANVLLHIINDILDFSKIEAGQMELENTAFDLKLQCKNAILAVKELAKQKSVELKIDWDPNLKTGQLGDPFRITQILNNFLSNATKFTEQGSVTIKTRLQGDMIKLSVIDTGIGIDDTGLKKLFVDFSQVDASTTRQFGGTGLGLAITKKLVELMGGSVGVESQLGKGSEFWTIIPNRPAELTQSDTSPKTAINIDKLKQESRRILLVDDNLVNRQIGEKILSKLGHQVSLACNGIEAVEHFKNEDVDRSHFDLVFMDCQMPEMDGYEATQKIRALGINIPIIALTANTTEEDRQKAEDCGMNDFLSKPFKIHELQETITAFSN